MVTEKQKEIQDLLVQAIKRKKSEKVLNMLKNNTNEDSDIQEALQQERTVDGITTTILNFAINRLDVVGQTKINNALLEIIEQIWERANRETRDFLCNRQLEGCNAIDMLRIFQQNTVLINQENCSYSITNVYPGLEKVMQEIENHIRDSQEAFTRRSREEYVANTDKLVEKPFYKIEKTPLWLNGLSDHNAPVVSTATSSNTSPAPTADNRVPEDNSTTSWSKHKGKIALGVVGLLVAGAVAAYVFVYPVVALVLAVSALAVLAGAYIGGVFEKSESPGTNTLNASISESIMYPIV